MPPACAERGFPCQSEGETNALDGSLDKSRPARRTVDRGELRFVPMPPEAK